MNRCQLLEGCACCALRLRQLLRHAAEHEEPVDVDTAQDGIQKEASPGPGLQNMSTSGDPSLSDSAPMRDPQSGWLCVGAVA